MDKFTHQQHETMLSLARTAITSFVTEGEWQESDPIDSDLLQESGAFVTLRIDGQLRGCTGYLKADRPVGRVVQEMAISAASSDPRFPPLNEKELNHVTIGISILSPLTAVKKIKEIQVGVHGLVITQDDHRGVLLPQVPAERGWDRETYLANLCYKAGLPPDAWKRGAQLFSFTAEVFGFE